MSLILNLAEKRGLFMIVNKFVYLVKQILDTTAQAIHSEDLSGCKRVSVDRSSAKVSQACTQN